MRTLAAPLALAPALAALVLGAASPAEAQVSPPESIELGYHHETGALENTGSGREVLASFSVYVEGATALRLTFDEVRLSGDETIGNESILRITSWLDGRVQELNARQVAEWRNTSCYFNGDSVQVEIVAWPYTGPSSLSMQKVLAEMVPTTAKSQCGPTDDRVLSSDPRVARLLDVGCSGWIMDDCNHCLITAGHCFSFGGFTVAEFNVPLSGSGGSLNHPGPEDQYSVDPASFQSVYGGVGNDYGVFGCHPNTVTGLTPVEAQGAWFQLAIPPAHDPAHTIRITGYGTDSTPSSHNQVQQTHSGPYYDHYGTTLRYTVDTTGGNSGSPVIWDDTGQAIGVHTHAGCSTSPPIEGNHGTGYNHPGFIAFVNFPQGVCAQTCPLTLYGTGKTNSQGCVPAISTSGSPSMSGGPGSFDIDASNFINNKNGMLFYGYQPASLPFQGGWLCVQPPLRRTSVQNSGGNPPPDDCSGTYSYDFGGLISSGVDPGLAVGEAFYAQYWGRDPASSPFPIGLSNAVEGTIAP